MALRTGNYGIAVPYSEGREIRMVDEQGLLIQPDAAPLLTLLASVQGRIKPLDQVKVEHYEDDYMSEWMTNSETVSATTGSTVLTPTDGTPIVAGQLIAAIPAATAGHAFELMRVTSVTAGVATVTRGYASTTPLQITPGMRLMICGSAYSEYAGVPAGRSTVPVNFITYPQVFRTACQPISKIAATVRSYAAEGKTEREKEHVRKMVEMKKAINKAFLFGKAAVTVDGGDGGNIYTTSGLKSRISTNVLDAGGTIDKRTFNSFLRQVFVYGSPTKVLLSCPILSEALSAWAEDQMIVEQGASTYGLSIKTWITPFGTLKIVNDQSLSDDGRYGTGGFGHLSFVVDMPELHPFYLKGGGEDHNIQLWLDRVKDGTTVYKDEVYCAYGLKVKHEKKHGFIYNITNYAAA